MKHRTYERAGDTITEDEKDVGEFEESISVAFNCEVDVSIDEENIYLIN